MSKQNIRLNGKGCYLNSFYVFFNPSIPPCFSNSSVGFQLLEILTSCLLCFKKLINRCIQREVKVVYHACVLRREPQQWSLFRISNSDNCIMTQRKTYTHPHPQNTSWLLCSEDFRSCSKMGLFKLGIEPPYVGRLMLLLMQELQPATMKI